MRSSQAPFVGRRAERTALVSELKAGARLVSITGPSGMGKTRLAQVLTKDLAEVFPGARRIRFCSLVGAQNRFDVESAISRALGLAKEHAPQLTRAMGGFHAKLLVLDNVDAMVDEVRSIVEELLTQWRELQIVVTSVIPLGLDEEVRYELGRLQLEDAARLYLERAGRFQRDRAGLAMERSAVDDLVRRLDGIPLAIELAAGRAEQLPPRALLSQISRRFEVLDTHRPGRHGSLLKALTITWELLGPFERLALSRISAFVGGFSLEAAEAVLGTRRSETLALLEELRSKALLQLEESEEPRFSPYESVREFAELQARHTSEAAENVRRHLEFFLQEGEAHAARLSRSDAGASIRWLIQEHENLLAAHRRALEFEPAASARVGLALETVLEAMGPHPSQKEILNSVVAAARASGDGALLLRALIARVSALNARGPMESAQADLSESWELAESQNDPEQQIKLLSESATIHSKVGEPELACAEIDRARLLAVETGNRAAEGSVLVARSLIAEHRGEHEASNAYLHEALALLRRHGLYDLTTRPLFNLGVNWSHLLDFRKARQFFEEARGIFQRLGNRTLEAYSEINLGAIEVAAGRLEQAEIHTAQALRTEGIRGRGRFEAQGLINLGLIAFERGELRLAQQRLQEALAITRENGERFRTARTLLYVSAVEASLGEHAAARAALDEARVYFSRVSDRSHLHAAEIYEGILEVFDAGRLEGDIAGAVKARVAARLSQAAANPANQRTTSLAIGRRILERALSGAASIVDRPPLQELLIGPGARWFELADGVRVSLGRRRLLRLLLIVLLEHRRSSPGGGLTVEELFAAVWAGEAIKAESASKRVYTAIWNLRMMGLSSVIVHHGEGYLIDPSLSIVMSDGGSDDRAIGLSASARSTAGSC